MSDVSCPSVSFTGLTCDKDDEFLPHTTLTHRNNGEFIEWPIDNSDRVRWGMVQEKRKKTSGTVVEDVADVITEDPTEPEEVALDNSE